MGQLDKMHAAYNQPDHDTAHDMMTLAFEHYFKHSEAVQKRLEHAKAATNESLDNVNKLKDYGTEWDEILGRFQSVGLSEEALQHIEGLLGDMPKIIDEVYSSLIASDQELQKLEEELASEKYQVALNNIDTIQQQPNPMSGLGPEEYDLDLQQLQNMEQIPEVEIYPVNPSRRS